MINNVYKVAILCVGGYGVIGAMVRGDIILAGFVLVTAAMFLTLEI